MLEGMKGENRDAGGPYLFPCLGRLSQCSEGQKERTACQSAKKDTTREGGVGLGAGGRGGVGGGGGGSEQGHNLAREEKKSS